MNNLARLPDVRFANNAADSTAADADFVSAAEKASRFAETFCGRRFVATVGTRYLQRHPRACGRELRISDDLASITSLTVDDDGDDTYELTLVVTTDYFVEREDDLDTNTPIVKLILNPNGTQLTVWPTAYRAVKIAGLWGYSYELESSTLTTNEALDSSETDVTVSATAAALIYPGDTIVVESEQMAVTAVSTVTLTVVRGINGSTAAAHDTAKAISIRRYPRDVERAVASDAARYAWTVATGVPGAFREQWGAIRDALYGFKDWAVA